MILAHFPHVKPSGPQLFTLKDHAKSEILDLLLKHRHLKAKSDAPLYSPTEYLPGYKSRSKHGVCAITAFVFDVERKDPSPLLPGEIEALGERLDASGLEYVLTSSYSHTVEDCRFRLVLFPDRAILPTEFKEARKRLRIQLCLDGIVDPAAEDVSRIFYTPSCPLHVMPVEQHGLGAAVGVDDLLEGYIAAPYEPGKKLLPEGWEYTAPVSPEEVDLKFLYGILDAYKAKGEDAQEAARKLNILRKVRKGEPFATTNLNSALWSAVNLLSFNFPPHTSSAEILAVLRPSLLTMYGPGKGPIGLTQALDVATRMVDRAVEKRAENDAADEEIRRAFSEAAATVDKALQVSATRTLLTIADLEKEEAALPRCDIVYCIPEERFYYKGPLGHFDLTSPVYKDGVTAHMRALGWDEGDIRFVMKNGTYAKAHGIDFAPRRTSLFSQDNRTIINSWQPPAITPAQGGYPSISKVMDSLFYNIVSNRDGQHLAVDEAGKEWFLNWLSWCVQNPAGVPGVAVLFNGAATGTGKNSMAHIIFRIFGEANCAKVTSRQLESRFTSTWIGRCFVFGDEIYSAESKNEITDVLKDLVTGQTVMSEGKGVNGREVRNRAKFLFASNNALPLRLDPEDRRFAVFTRHEPITSEYREFTQALFTPENQSTPAFDEEIAAFAWDLERREVDVKALRVPYPNHSRASLVSAGESSNVAFCRYVDEYGIDGLVKESLTNKSGFLETDWRKQATAVFGEEWDLEERGLRFPAIHAAYMAFCKKTGISHPVAANKFGSLVQSHRPEWPHKYVLAADKVRRLWTYTVRRNTDVAAVAA